MSEPVRPPVEHRYGDHPAQVGDLRLPSGEPPEAGWPTAVVLHGGSWEDRYRRDLTDRLAADLATQGLATWNLEYRRLGGGGGWPATFLDVAAGVDHLADLPAPLDLDRLVLVGHSAGGTLALWAAARHLLPAASPGSDPTVRAAAVVGLAPITGLARYADHVDNAAALAGARPAEDDARFDLVDPCRLAGHGLPVLLVHGTEDESVPVSESEAYRDAVVGAGGQAELVTGAGDHMALVDPDVPLTARAVGATAELAGRPR